MGAIGANGEITAAGDPALRETELSIDLGAGETHAAIDLGAAHDPVAAHAHHVGLDRPAMAVNLDIARRQSLADAGSCER